MSPLLVLLVLVIYVLAVVLLWRERSLRYLLMLLAGHLAMLLTPLWQRLYEIDPAQGVRLPSLAGVEFSWPIIIGGGPLLALPTLVFYYGLRHRWWPRHYAAIWMGFATFIAYFIIVERLLESSGTVLVAQSLIIADTPIPGALIQAVLLAGVSLGMLYVLVSTRHYGLDVAILALLLSGIVASLLFLGIFASPLWVAGLLGQDGLFATGAALVSLLLVLWGVHLLASGLHAGRSQQLLWR